MPKSCRILYDNLITSAAMLNASSLRNGLVTNAVKDGAGSAVITPSGNFSGTADTEYIVEIESIAAGAEIGQATFRWSNGGGSWEASSVITSSTNITLENGVNIKWTSGSGADFVVGDRWYFKAVLPFGPEYALDLDRDTRLRTAGLESPNTFTIDMGSAKEVEALILYDHNLSSSAVVTLKGHNSDSWSSPGFSETVPWSAEKICHFLSVPTTKQYWRLEISDIANDDGYLNVGNLFLGAYFQPSRHYLWGSQNNLTSLFQENRNPYGKNRARFYNLQNDWLYQFKFTDDDILTMQSILAAISDRDTGIIKPIFWVPDTASPNNFWLVDFLSLSRSAKSNNNNPVELTLKEVLKSV